MAPLTSDGIAAGNQPRAATAADISELLHLRALMLSSLGQDPGNEGALWRKRSAAWFSERLARPEAWAFRVIGPSGSLIEWLSTRGVARLELHASPDGLEMYRRAGFSEDPYLAMYRMSSRPK